MNNLLSSTTTPQQLQGVHEEEREIRIGSEYHFTLKLLTSWFFSLQFDSTYLRFGTNNLEGWEIDVVVRDSEPLVVSLVSIAKMKFRDDLKRKCKSCEDGGVLSAFLRGAREFTSHLGRPWPRGPKFQPCLVVQNNSKHGPTPPFLPGHIFIFCVVSFSFLFC